MLELIQTIYIIGAVIAISAAVPQVRTLLRVQSSEGFNLATWGTWLGTQCCTLLYVCAFGTPLLIMVNAIWVGFYCLMLSLILRYRTKAPEPLELMIESQKA